ncbi:MAG: hypothetical protein DMG55_12520 [Acidobacteria bacterium]|nr:MAG: hypothetical protein DMG55_12520 [Acidobacteriota bacterium]
MAGCYSNVKLMVSFDKSLLFASCLLVVVGTGSLRSLAQSRTEPRKPAVRASKEQTKLSFNETIQPILSENCYACHGPDPGARKAKLRLDRAEFAFVPHDKFGPAIIQESAGAENRGEESQGSHAASGSAQDSEARANRALARVGEGRGGVRGALVVPRTKGASRSRCEASRVGAQCHRQLHFGAPRKGGVDSVTGSGSEVAHSARDV